VTVSRIAAVDASTCRAATVATSAQPARRKIISHETPPPHGTVALNDSQHELEDAEIERTNIREGRPGDMPIRPDHRPVDCRLEMFAIDETM